MAKNDNSHAIRFLESMNKHGKHAEAVTFAENYPLSKSAVVEKKFEWAQHQCEFMKEHLLAILVWDVVLKLGLFFGQNLVSIFSDTNIIEMFRQM